MHQGNLTPVGVTDSVLHPNGISFLRFDYPSAVPSELQRRMAGIAEQFMRSIEFEGSLFNMEFFVGPDGDLKIIEVNGRMASQFGPLVKAVHGVSTYEVQLDLVSGGSPELPPAREDLVASSFVLRTYEDAVVEAVPDPAAVLERFPHAQVELLVRPGQRLSDNDDDVEEPPPGAGGAGRADPRGGAGPVRGGEAPAALRPPAAGDRLRRTPLRSEADRPA